MDSYPKAVNNDFTLFYACFL